MTTMPIDELPEETAGTSRHAYPASAMVGDYLRAAAGLVPSGLLLVVMPVGTTAAVVLGGFAAIFALFGLRTAWRHGTSLEMTETELRARGPWRPTIEWAKLDRMRLAYYSTSRDRRSGEIMLFWFGRRSTLHAHAALRRFPSRNRTGFANGPPLETGGHASAVVTRRHRPHLPSPTKAGARNRCGPARAQPYGGTAVSGSEDGSDRPARRRRGARLQ